MIYILLVPLGKGYCKPTEQSSLARTGFADDEQVLSLCLAPAIGPHAVRSDSTRPLTPVARSPSPRLVSAHENMLQRHIFEGWVTLLEVTKVQQMIGLNHLLAIGRFGYLQSTCCSL